MEFSPYLPVVSLMLVVIEGFFSQAEKTFWPNQEGGPKIKLPFILHGGVVVGDFFILSYLYGIWFHNISIPCWAWIILFFIAAPITWLCHKGWWAGCEKQPGFMYPHRIKSGGDIKYWYRDLPDSAWVHVIYMTWSIMMIGAYIFSPMPDEVVWRTFQLILVFVPLAIIEPGIVQDWKPTKKSIVFAVRVAIALWAVDGLVAWAKLAHLQLHWHFISINL